MKTSELLTKAREYLWDGKDDKALEFEGKTEYVCFAVHYAERNLEESHKLRALVLSSKFRLCIQERMLPHNNLWCWLNRTCGIPEEDLTHERVQAHRLAWMNELIKEYRAKGD